MLILDLLAFNDLKTIRRTAKIFHLHSRSMILRRHFITISDEDFMRLVRLAVNVMHHNEKWITKRNIAILRRTLCTSCEWIINETSHCDMYAPLTHSVIGDIRGCLPHHYIDCR